jgi:putative ABC transport system permease protein
MEGGILNGSKPIYSYLFLGISFFILLMASINFINLNIASSLKRVKEVGIRKINGSSKVQIILQFMGESAILCTIAFLLAIILTQGILPYFNHLANKQIELQDFNTNLLVWLLLLLVANILITGFYPAYVLSNFKAVDTLTNKQKVSGKNVFAQSLIVLQFFLAVFLITGSIVFYAQMEFIKTKDLGYNPYQVIMTNIPGNREYKPIREWVKNEVAKEPSIKQISFGGGSGGSGVAIGNQTIKTTYRRVDQNHLVTLGIRLKAGQNFSHENSNEAIVNESFVKQAGLINPVGTTFKNDDGLLTITGVVKDFHFGSLKERIQPMVMYQQLENSGTIWLKIDQSQQQQALTAFERIYKKAIPDAIYEYNFLDELNAMEYKQEQRWENIITIATILSLLICCLGLFGLTQLAIQQRIKEIGIRKVLGASARQIIALFSTQFVKLVLIACLIATPISWWATFEWLQNFAYRIQISGLVFVLAGAVAVFIALLTLSLQIIKVAVANPVRSLRTE